MSDARNPGPEILRLVKGQGAGFVLELVVNFALPYLIYDHFKDQLGDVKALIASSAPPLIWTVITFIRARRVDFIAGFVLFGMALSLLAMLGGGSIKFLQLRERLVTIVIGLTFLASAAIGRPIIYEFVRAGMKRQNNHALLADLEARRDDPGVKQTMMVMTLVWGFGLLADAAAAVVLVMTLSVKQYLIAGPILGYAFSGALVAWTFLYVRRRRRLGEARRAQAEAAALAAGETP